MGRCELGGGEQTEELSPSPSLKSFPPPSSSAPGPALFEMLFSSVPDGTDSLSQGVSGISRTRLQPHLHLELHLFPCKPSSVGSSILAGNGRPPPPVQGPVPLLWELPEVVLSPRPRCLVHT